MGSTNVFNTTGMKSLVWKQKRERLQSKKKHKEAAKDALAAVAAVKKGSVSNATEIDPNKPFDSRTDFVAPPQSHLAQLKNLRMDRSHESGRGG
jgi:hypothetical protein